MKPFNLEEYLANPSKKVITREGRDARIVCTDRKVDSYTKCTIVALVADKEGYEGCVYFTKNGKYMDGYESPYDLFFAPKKEEGWINIYKDYQFGRVASGIIFSSKEEAEEAGRSLKVYITTVKIEWEE